MPLMTSPPAAGAQGCRDRRGERVRWLEHVLDGCLEEDLSLFFGEKPPDVVVWVCGHDVASCGWSIRAQPIFRHLSVPPTLLSGDSQERQMGDTGSETGR